MSKCDIVKRGEFGVNFLARYYSKEIWYGNTSSMCDWRRTLSKFHTSTTLPHHITPWYKMRMKSLSAVINDGDTPVLGPYCKTFLKLSGGLDECVLSNDTAQSDLSWAAREAAQLAEDNGVDISETAYPNDNGDHWMEELIHQQCPGYDIQAFYAWLGSVETVDELMHAPLFDTAPLLYKDNPTDPVLVSDDTFFQHAHSNNPVAKQKAAEPKRPPLSKKKRTKTAKATTPQMIKLPPRPSPEEVAAEQKTLGTNVHAHAGVIVVNDEKTPPLLTPDSEKKTGPLTPDSEKKTGPVLTPTSDKKMWLIPVEPPEAEEKKKGIGNPPPAGNKAGEPTKPPRNNKVNKKRVAKPKAGGKSGVGTTQATKPAFTIKYLDAEGKPLKPSDTIAGVVVKSGTS
jgi:hypothetical protein